MIKYPLLCTTYATKTAFLERAIMLLQKEHNIMGAWFSEGITLNKYEKLRAKVQTEWPYTEEKLSRAEWDRYQEEYNDQEREVYLKSHGLKCIEILDIADDRDKITNDYKLADDTYRRYYSKTKGLTESYKLRRVKLRIHHWEGKEIQGLMGWSKLSEKVWWKILELSRKLKRLGYDQGKYILYWKRTPSIVWFAFLTDTRWTQLSPYIKECSSRKPEVKKRLKVCIAWDGWKAYTPHYKFDKFYNPHLQNILV